MPRQRKGIAHINERDMAAFRILFFCHHAPRSLLPVTDSRLKIYEKMGIIERCRDLDNNEIIRRSSQGKKYFSKLPELADRKAYNGYTAAIHNCKLAEVYSSLTPEQQSRWHTEREIADLYQQRLDELRYTDFDRWRELVDKPQYSPTDAAIINEDGEVEVLIEITTGNYELERICEKEACASVLQAPINYYKA